MSVPTLAAAGWIVAALVMAALWAWSVRLQNAGVVDVGWTGLVGSLAVLHALASPGAIGRRIGARADRWFFWFYRRYQDTTSAFVPWFPKRAA